MKLSIVMPTKDRKYFTWAYNNLLKNKGNHELFICSIADNCKDDTNEYFKSLGEFDDHFKYIINDSGKDWGCAYGYNKIIKELVDTEIFMIFHTDMYLAPGALDAIEKYIKPKTVLSLNRVEPPLHTQSQDKIQADYGTSIETFKEEDFLKFVEYKQLSQKGKFGVTAFAPTIAYKSDYEEVGYHDDINFRPFMFEDTDLYQRFILNGVELKQIKEAFVYHFTCKSWRYKNEGLQNLKEEELKYYEDVNVKNARNFTRKWGRFFKNDDEGNPLMTGRYDVGYVVHNCDEYSLLLLEPWCDTFYSDAPYTKYISVEQKNTQFDLKSKLKYLSDSKTNDVIVEFDAKKLTQDSFMMLSDLQFIIEKTNRIGSFEYGIFKVTINKLVDHRNELIHLNDKYYQNKLLKINE